MSGRKNGCVKTLSIFSLLDFTSKTFIFLYEHFNKIVSIQPYLKSDSIVSKILSKSLSIDLRIVFIF